jgi:hypothetical protein
LALLLIGGSAAAEVYRDPACSGDGAITPELAPVAMQCIGNNRFNARYPGDVWSMEIAYDPCGDAEIAISSFHDDVSFPAGPDIWDVVWRSPDGLSAVAVGSFAGVTLSRDDEPRTVGDTPGHGAPVVELNFADVDADIRVMGEAPQALSLLESTDRENIKTFLGVGMIECELVR